MNEREINEIGDQVQANSQKLDRILEILESKHVTPDKLSAMTVSGLAKHYGVSRPTIGRWRQCGKLDENNRRINNLNTRSKVRPRRNFPK